jgi:hypothetical protein
MTIIEAIQVMRCIADEKSGTGSRRRSLLEMKYFVPFLLIVSLLPTSIVPLNAQSISRSKTFNGPDRTITWGPWQQNAKDEFRFRTGDRYLGRAVWEHYLGFEQVRTSSKAIKLSMIRLGNEDLREEVVIRPGFRYFENNQRHNDRPQR